LTEIKAQRALVEDFQNSWVVARLEGLLRRVIIRRSHFTANLIQHKEGRSSLDMMSMNSCGK
jgi:hypothetical protein